MTSKEELTILINANLGDKKSKKLLSSQYGVIVSQLFNYLEVLEILKSNVVSLNMIAIFETCEGYNDWAREYHRYGYLLTKEQFNKVKEWLENE